MKNKDYPIVNIINPNQGDEHVIDGKTKYSCARLFHLAKDLPVFDLPLAALDLSSTPFDGENMMDLAYHARKIMDADLSYPIILFQDGVVADGRHRIIRALADGKATIKAVRLEHNPTPCGIVKDE